MGCSSDLQLEEITIHLKSRASIVPGRFRRTVLEKLHGPGHDRLILNLDSDPCSNLNAPLPLAVNQSSESTLWLVGWSVSRITCAMVLLSTSPPTGVMALNSSLSATRKGGEKQTRTGEDDLDSDTSLVHSQLRVRGGVSLGQYHSTVELI